MINIQEIAERNQQRAWEVIKETDIYAIWESVSAEVHLVGSLPNGLLMKHRDIDFHIYSSPINVSDSFAAMAKLAENPSIQRIEYRNLLDTEEECIEWHAWYQDKDNDLWQLDMIHIRKGSCFDGYVEKVTKRVKELLTPATCQTILQLKYDTPDTAQIMGIEYYKAVIQDNIKTYEEFTEWRKSNPPDEMMEWMP